VVLSISPASSLTFLVDIHLASYVNLVIVEEMYVAYHFSDAFLFLCHKSPLISIFH
jgi:hypothetical protein